MTDLAALLLTFLCGAAYESGCAFLGVNRMSKV